MAYKKTTFNKRKNLDATGAKNIFSRIIIPSYSSESPFFIGFIVLPEL